MKRIFYLALCSVVFISVHAQSPGGVSGSVLWLRSDVGATPGTWVDQSGNANNFTQPTPAQQPTLGANSINFHGALSFDGTQFLTQPSPLNFPTFNTDRTIFTVANATASDGFRWLFMYGSPGFSNATFQTGNFAGSYTNAFYASFDDISYPSSGGGYWDQPQNTYGALSTFSLASNTENQYDRGVLVNTKTSDGQLIATSTNSIIGAINTTPTETWAGNMTEIILFPTALNNSQRNQVESYLAFKYGLTLGSTGTPVNYVASDGSTTFWTGIAGYQNDVFGIGTDNGSLLVQQQSNSQNSGVGNGVGQPMKGNLIVSSSTPLLNNQFLMIGNDAGSLSEQTIGTGEAPPAAVGSQRVGRNWLVQNTGNTGAVDLSFDMNGMSYTGGIVEPKNYLLMIDNDGDGNYNTGTIQYVQGSSITPDASNTGYNVNFSGVTFPNNATFTIITQTSALLPAVWEAFTVSLQNNLAVLNWKTSLEVNVDHYTAEWSADGKAFEPFATIVAKNGTTNNYSTSQNDVPVGTRYYHIKRTDKDGLSETSVVRSVRVGGANSLQLRYNPVANGTLEININVQQSQDAVILVTGTDGKVVMQLNKGLAGGTNKVSADVSHLGKGSYFLQVQLHGQVMTTRFVKM